MSVETLTSNLPAFAADLRANLASLLADPALTEQQRLGTLLASAIAARNPALIEAAEREVAGRLSPEAAQAARMAASMMSMNNVFYRFLHLVSRPEYGSLPAKLQMTSLGRPGAPGIDVAAWMLAVSAINGCGMCIQGHEQELRKGGLSAEAVHTIVRFAAVIHAIAVALEASEIARKATAA